MKKTGEGITREETLKAVKEMKNALHEAEMTTYALEFVKESLGEAVDQCNDKFLSAMYANLLVLYEKLEDELGKTERPMGIIDRYIASLGQQAEA